VTHHAIRFADLTARQAYKVMIGTVVPRPIAWVTTVSPEGVVNAAPYSFFNCLSADPPILALGVENKPDGRFKDTAWNIRRTEVFTVNICDMANLVPMSKTAAGFDPETDELAMAGLAAVPGKMIDCPRIGEAPVAFECRRHVSVAVSGAREIILGRVEMAHVREDIIDLDTHYSDARNLDAIGRMGGDGYCSTRDLFDFATPSVAEVEAGRLKQTGSSG
jgi:flavin reductase (DIM6/NTAB) family NADH-FMN oxidoreductase RutF